MEIEFRGKILNSNEWAYGFYFYSEKENKHYIIGESIDYGYQKIEIDPKTLGQYVNKKDAHETKIYDGDLLADCDDLYVVTYSVVDAEWVLLLDNVEISLGQCDTEWYEVMGNIHDIAVEV